MDPRHRLLRRLDEAGVPDDVVADADREGRLGLLAVEIALGGRRKHTVTALAREAGMTGAHARELLQALGRPRPSRGERAFTDEDVELARLARRLQDAGLPREDIVEAARVVGQGMSQVAEALRRMVGDALIEPGDTDHALGERYVAAVDDLGPEIPSLLALSLRAHLRDGIRRELITDAEREAGRLADTREVAVAFADLVGYTELGNELEAVQLGSIAGRFGDLARAAVREPVRLVKTLGDAAMFVSHDARQVVGTLVELRERVAAEDPSLPHVRIGVAHGPATPRGGDWFGATVNVASRVTEAAKPGQLLATEEVAELVPDPAWKRRRKRNLKGVDGRLRLFSYEQAG